MTVAELIELLQAADPNGKVYVMYPDGRSDFQTDSSGELSVTEIRQSGEVFINAHVD